MPQRFRPNDPHNECAPPHSSGIDQTQELVLPKCSIALSIGRLPVHIYSWLNARRIYATTCQPQEYHTEWIGAHSRADRTANSPRQGASRIHDNVLGGLPSWRPNDRTLLQWTMHELKTKGNILGMWEPVSLRNLPPKELEYA